MKKNLLYMFAMATVMVACSDEDYTNWADPQTSEPETAQTVSFTATAASAIDFANVTSDMVTIFNPTVAAEEMTSVKYIATLDEKIALEANEQGQVSAEDLRKAVETLYGKRPDERTIATAINAFVDIDGQSVKASADVTLKVTLVAPVIETGYYLIGTPNGWNGSDASTFLPFSHSGKDVYDDPVFTLMFELKENSYWKIVSQSSYTKLKDGEISEIWGEPLLGPAQNDDPSPSGTLVNADAGAGLIEGSSGWVKMTLNMMDYAYTIELLDMEPVLYIPGGYQGWNPETAATVATKNFDFKYDGYANMTSDGWDQGFKFTPKPNWDMDYGTDEDNPGTLVEKGGNLSVDEAGFYRLTVDLSAIPYTYSVTKTEWGLIGDATPGGWDASTPMTLDGYTWKVTTTMTDGGFKFRANNGWDINLGGDVNNLNYDGDNIGIEAGEYEITLDLSNPTAYKAIIVKK
ncbi:DUF5115 domain-containing protein [Bacteroides sp. OttesenSCG-928-E20]|nr:DUF5115 domain-containing protein [Bacteroides sp. OttesenSCG-928-N06]MDL2299547.1 DUF5115 domain-containing protein [Bacteroides sp. OttesenSCG-928-E20]